MTAKRILPPQKNGALEPTQRQALQLDGKNNYLLLPECLFDSLNQTTIEAWIKWERVSSFMQILGFGERNRVLVINSGISPCDLQFYIQLSPHELDIIAVPDIIPLKQWCHIAALSGPQGMRLYFNGVQIGNNDRRACFADLAPCRNNYLGRSHWEENSDFCGALAEVRVWNRTRSQEHIRRDMCRALRGDEEGLMALWNFAHGDGRDASVNGRHGQLIGAARCAKAALPASASLDRPSIVRGRLVDTDQKPLVNAGVRLESDRAVLREVQSDAEGLYHMVVPPIVLRHTPLHLCAAHGDAGAWHTELDIAQGQSLELDMVLREGPGVAGSLLALDGTPHVSHPIQLHRLAPEPQAVSTVCSDGGGRYRFSNLRAGTYRVSCPRADDSAQAARSKTFAINTSVREQKIDLNFARPKRGKWTLFTHYDGLAHNAVRCAFGDAEHIWFGTWGGGACRFDGERFETFTQRDGLPSNYVWNIAADHQKNLWFGTWDGGACRFDGERFETFGTRDGLPGNRIRDLCGDRKYMWFAIEWGGVARFDGERFETFRVRDGLASDMVFSIAYDGAGGVWFGTAGGLSHFDGDQFRTFTTQDGLPSSFIFSLYMDSDNALWAGTGGGLVRFDGKNCADADLRFTTFDERHGLSNGRVCSVHSAGDGQLWLSTPHRIARFDGRLFEEFSDADCPALTSINLDLNSHIYCESAERLWVCTEDGVLRYDSGALAEYSARDGLIPGAVRALACTRGGDLWCGTEFGLSRFDGRSFANYSLEDGLPAADKHGVPMAHIKAIAEMADGRVFFGSAGGGAYAFDGENFAYLSPRGAGSSPEVIDAVSTDADGHHWVACRWLGAAHFDGRRFAQILDRNITRGTVRAVHCAPDGSVWFGTEDGLVHLRDSETTVYTAADGLVDESVYAVYCDRDGTVWAGTLGGISRFDGSASTDADVPFTSFTTADGLAYDHVLCIFQDRDGLMWFGTSGGGVACFDGHVWGSFDTRYGLSNNTVYAIDQDAEGHLWFATHTGLTRYKRGRQTPKAHIVAVSTHKRHTDLDQVPAVEVGARARLEFGATDFKTQPGKRQYRWRLGATDSAVGAWSKAEAVPHFDWLPQQAGEYLFELQAIDCDLNYSTPVSLCLRAVPAPHEEILRQTRAQLETAYRDLAERNALLEEATAEAERARQAADAANRAKSVFLANMSHEIRTPMNAILGYAQLLLCDDQLPAKYREGIETIDKSGAHLLALIDEVLDISRIEAGRLDVQVSDFNLVSLAHELGVMFDLRCSQKGLAWRLEGLAAQGDAAAVRGDASKLRQVLINLLSNAVKFTQLGQVLLRIGRVAPQRYLFEVVDTGPGISPARQRAIFEPFQQGDTQSEGSGLGLTIAHRLIDLIGGKLELDSTPERGARFYFTLPLAAALESLEAPLGAGEHRIARLVGDSAPTVLIADDVPENRAVLAGMLEQIGCTVFLAADGAQALKQYDGAPPDIVFMDIRMPVLDGRSAARHLWNTHGVNCAPIVAISASALVHEQEEYLNDNFAAFIAKPYRFEQICECLARFLHVEFEFQDAHIDSTAPSATALPEPLRARLRRAAELGEVTELEESLQQVRRLGEAGQRLADHLAELSRNLDMAAILAILNQTDHD